MNKWMTVHDSREQRPPEVDTTSSMYTVYVRKNIRQEDITDRDSLTGLDGMEHKVWVYEEMQYTQEEYAHFNGPQTEALMQALADQTSDIVMANLTDTKPDEITAQIMQVLNDSVADLAGLILSNGG